MGAIVANQLLSGRGGGRVVDPEENYNRALRQIQGSGQPYGGGVGSNPAWREAVTGLGFVNDNAFAKPLTQVHGLSPAEEMAIALGAPAPTFQGRGTQQASLADIGATQQPRGFVAPPTGHPNAGQPLFVGEQPQPLLVSDPLQAPAPQQVQPIPDVGNAFQGPQGPAPVDLSSILQATPAPQTLAAAGPSPIDINALLAQALASIRQPDVRQRFAGRTTQAGRQYGPQGG